MQSNKDAIPTYLPYFVSAGTAATLMAILYGLMPDEQWNARFNPSGHQHRTGWAAVIGVIAALMVGAGILMATIAFGMQHYFEYQIEEARKISK